MTGPTSFRRDDWEDRWARRRREPVDGLAVAERWLQQAVSLGDRPGQALALVLAGACRWRTGDHPGALRDLLSAQGMVGDQPALRRNLLTELGVVRNHLGEPDLAVEDLLDALHAHELTDDAVGQADTLNALGIVFYHRGEHDEAARAYERSAALRRTVGDEEGLAGCRNNLAKVHTGRGDTRAALAELAGAARHWELTGDWRSLGMVLTNAGIAVEAEGASEDAAAYYQAALSVRGHVDDRYGVVETLRRLGQLRAAAGRLDEAVSMLQRAAEEAARLGLADEEAQACEALAQLHESADDHRGALEWFKRFHHAREQAMDERSARRLQGLQVAYQLERAEEESRTDPLTSLLNRRGFDRRLRDELERAQREGSPLSLALADLDFFKRINDKWSHAAGDEVLREMARLLTSHTRAGDVVARYGGEEFAILLPDTGLREAAGAAEQLCARVRSHDWGRLRAGLAMTVSIGVACTEDAPDPAALLAIADRNLYQAKHAGKDGVSA